MARRERHLGAGLSSISRRTETTTQRIRGHRQPGSPATGDVDPVRATGADRDTGGAGGAGAAGFCFGTRPEVRGAHTDRAGGSAVQSGAVVAEPGGSRKKGTDTLFRTESHRARTSCGSGKGVSPLFSGSQPNATKVSVSRRLRTDCGGQPGPKSLRTGGFTGETAGDKIAGATALANPVRRRDCEARRCFRFRLPRCHRRRAFGWRRGCR